MSRAIRNPWKTLPAPQMREALSFEAAFSEAEIQLLNTGVIPTALSLRAVVFLTMLVGSAGSPRA
jgi:hypothetical protein